ncbi:uncharacterized protein KY384_004512 [Bacidia gigantensis]|uniref:uncharacterized protein n=1 Tax=Bacidia gigantensis TaxID=2732470 RepID=UPI001D041710|nr:uncharacterized protein KY384_004512 [Bacidia gigantensis]KAG8531154.1 hypothetical protein KY384_004512 [Bacidia gigantensis]
MKLLRAEPISTLEALVKQAQYAIRVTTGIRANFVKNYLNTPDGREGWASYFLKHGYTIYLTDPPQRGRSPWIPGEGTVEAVPVSYVQKYFTTSEVFAPTEWPQASLHTQWPGTGLVGDPIFDAFYASQVQLQTSAFISDDNTKPAYNALLDKIGNAILVTHSQSGPYGWVAGDARPELVKGIIAVEPEGPPFVNETGPTGPPRLDGVTRLPLHYDPPVTDIVTDLKTVTIPPPEGKHYTSCTIQAEPARKLVNLSNVPVVLITGEASYHAPYDYCTIKFFEQTGVPITWIDLPSERLRGNGHFLFMERNNLEIAGLVLSWLEKTIK